MTTTAITTSKQIDLSAIDRATNLQDSTKFKYTREIEKFLETGASLGDYEAVQAHALTSPHLAVRFLKQPCDWLRLITKGLSSPVLHRKT